MWRPGDDGPDRDSEFGSIAYNNRNHRLPLGKQRALLPIAKHKHELLYALESHATLILVGETGSGKTTQLPQFLYEVWCMVVLQCACVCVRVFGCPRGCCAWCEARRGAASAAQPQRHDAMVCIPTHTHTHTWQGGWTTGGRVVICTQPRRVAAVTVAERVSEEMGTHVGDVVGYAVRFDDKTSPRTQIKFCTDGLLIREALRDPLLSRVSVVIVDEAHERSLHSDVLLGLLKKVQRRRRDLRVVVSSATMDAEAFRDFFESYRGGKGGEGGEGRGGSAIAATTGKPGASSSAAKRALAAVDNAMKHAGAGQDMASHVPPHAPRWSLTRKFDAQGRAIAPTVAVASITGRTHPVEVHFTEKPIHDYVKKAADTVLDIHRFEAPSGDVLVFLPGMEEVDTCVRMLRQSDDTGALNVLPLYAALPSHDQTRVFYPSRPGMRKVICATTIAETSVTIDGVKFVVDCGFVRLPFFNPETGIESLITAPTSRASAIQRSGRAGRTAPGKCYRLYTEPTFHDETIMPATTPPEMQRISLTWAVLTLKGLGIDDIMHFDFMSPPSAESMMHALEMLYSLGALNDDCGLTSPLGEMMAEFPVEPRLARALLASWEFGCGDEMVVVAALLSVGDVWLHPRGSKAQYEKLDQAMAEFAVREGDHITLLNVYRGYEDEAGQDGSSAGEWCQENMVNHRAMRRAIEVQKQIRGYLMRLGSPDEYGTPGGGTSASSQRSFAPLASCGDDTDAILKCVTTGFFANVARLGTDGLYHAIRGHHTVQLHPSSTLAKFGAPPEFVIFDQYVSMTHAYLKNCSRVNPRWLIELAPHFYETRDSRGANPTRKRQRTYGATAPPTTTLTMRKPTTSDRSQRDGRGEGERALGPANEALQRLEAKEHASTSMLASATYSKPATSTATRSGGTTHGRSGGAGVAGMWRGKKKTGADDDGDRRDKSGGAGAGGSRPMAKKRGRPRFL